MQAAPSEGNSVRDWDKDASFRDQVISTVLQTLHCLEPRITLLDIVSAILSSGGKYDKAKHAMLKPPGISKLFDTLVSCDANKEFLRYNAALHAVLNRVDAETRSIVSRLGEDGVRHPILLGHSEIRSENSAAPFLKAIVNQVNTSTRLAQERTVQQPEPVASRVSADYDFEFDWMGCLDESSPTFDPTSQEEAANGVAVEPENETSHQESSKSLEEHLKRLIGAGDLQQSTVEDTASQANSVASTLVAQTPSSTTMAPEDNVNVGESVEPKAEKPKKRIKLRQKRKIDEVDTETAGIPIFSAPLRPVPDLLKIDPSLLPPRKTIRRKAAPKSNVLVYEEECEVESSLIEEPHPDVEGSASIFAEGGSSNYVCDACPKRFKSLRSLADHKNIHTGLRPYMCPTNGCGKQYSNVRSLRNHERKHRFDVEKGGQAVSPIHSPSRPRKAKKKTTESNLATSDAEKGEAASDDEEELGNSRKVIKNSPGKAHQISKGRDPVNLSRRRRPRKSMAQLATKPDPPITTSGGGKNESEAGSDDDEKPASTNARGGSKTPAGPVDAAKPEAHISTSSPSQSQKEPLEPVGPGTSITEERIESRNEDAQSSTHSFEGLRDGTPTALPCCDLATEHRTQQLLLQPHVQMMNNSPFGRRAVLQLPFSARSLEALS